MKKTLLPATLLFGILATGYSQDKIITVNNDTIDCKINKITHNTVFFDMTDRGVRFSGKLPLISILNYTISGKTTPEEQKAVNSEPFERLRLGMNGGLGYLLGSTKTAEEYMVNLGFKSDQVQSYYRNMKSGMYANADLTYLITQEYGFGIKYKFFDTSGSIEGFFDPQDGVNLIYTTYKEQIYVNFIGTTFFYQQFIGSQKSLKLNSAYSLGLATYRNEAEYLSGYFLLTGKNVGMDISLGLEYFITRQLSVGTDLSAFYSSIRKMKVSDGTNTSTVNLEKDNYENLSRLDFSLGIRLYIWNK